MMDDPFVSNSSEGVVTPRDVPKFSFDTQLFSLDASSPAQAKRALEAHLAETERRLEEASKLGTALIEQQKSLEEKLKEVEQQQEDGQIGPELRRKLADLEKEYNEIGRETARAFLGPKRLAGGDDAHLGTPSLDPKSPLASVFFAGQATNSPSKVSVPSRKQRNQPSSRVHDIEFATEISTSLLAQVRQLQALLAEREEALKTVNLEKSRLELEAEGYAQRIRVLDESEERYKDENWALETRTHELMAAMKEAADREGRISSHLAAVTSEKNAVERELEDLKQTNAKLVEDHTAAQKANDAEIHLLRRNLNAGDAEKLALQQKVEELNSQNEELAKAVAMRIRQHQQESIREVSLDNDSDDQDQITPENSPPPSPNKFTPRHNHLETETLRSSLGHAHRMIQNLKSTIHREKTEKIELKRMLQEARDEVEQRRREAAAPTGPTSKRQKTKSDSVRKLARPDLLGAGRKGRTEVEVHDTEWEDNAGEGSPSHKSARNVSRGRPEVQSSDEPSDAYHTATEADDAFETANERETATESEAFQTGIESMADDSTDSDELTETEDRVQTTPRGRVSSLTLAKARDRNSFQSTASTSADEDDSEDGGFASPSQNSTPRFRLHKKRSVLRKIRPSGEAPMAYGSRPPSARQSPATSFTQAPTASEGQSLFAELAELEGGDGEEEFGPPMQQDTASQASTPRMLPVSDSRRASEISLDTPKPPMVDSGVMTDPWEPVVPTSSEGLGEQPSAPTTPTKPVPVYADMAVETTESPQVVHSATQWTPLKGAPESQDDHVAFVPTPPKMAWDEHAAEERDASVSLPELNVSQISFEETLPLAPKLPELSTSYFVGGTTEPVELPAPEPLEMVLSAISSQLTEPVTAKLPDPEPKYVPDMALSVVSSEHTLPVVATFPEPTPPAPVAEHGTSTDVTELSVSVISFQQTEPIEATLPEPTPEPEPTVVVDPVVTEAQVPDLTVTFITPECTEPVAPHPKESPRSLASELSLSTIRSVETLPVESTPAISVVPVPAPLPSGENVPPAESGAITADKPTSDAPSVVVAEDSPVDRSVGEWDKTGATRPLSAISGNTVPRHTRRQSSTQTDHGAQTILSSKQIDQILMDRVSSRPLSPPDSDRAKELSNSPFATPKPRTRPSHQSSTTSLHKRPGSAASQTSSIQSHPPLPPDHKEIIMAAEKKSMELRPASPALMGPPLAPASAYRTNSAQRPRTPNESVGQVSSAKSTTSRVKVRRESLASRRSSVSSFASELDERFNINANQAAMAHGYAAGTDPRMIQAITQTMIGEFLWKYTRKTGSSDMSNTRHRRYFWVHPYTRTLYWSTQDPQSAGKSELKTKSVAIEAIRVVADDNPYPPGLHCRSLEVVSPGRRVRFTATTSQRHETWFNALSYLLLRNSENEEDDGNVTLEDIDEFNPGFRSRSRQTARLSISSSQSRTARNWPKQRAGSALSVRHSATPGRLSPALSTPSNYSRRSSSSRLSTILNTTIKGSFGRRGPNHATASLHDGSVHDQNSEEDLRQMMERQEQEADRLENVRACCDGKHDVGSLARTSRYSPRVNRIHSHH